MNLTNIFLDASPPARETKVKNNQMRLRQTKKLLHSKENHQQKEKTAYGIEENIYKYILHMELISNTYMEFTQLNSKNI